MNRIIKFIIVFTLLTTTLIFANNRDCEFDKIYFEDLHLPMN